MRACLSGLAKTFSSLDFWGTAAECYYCMHYVHEMFSDKWILNPCGLYKATDEVHNGFDLVSCSTSLLQTDSLLFCLPCSTRGFTAGAKSNCAYNVKDCCQDPYIIPTYGIHSCVKYTCTYERYMTIVCIQSTLL